MDRNVLSLYAMIFAQRVELMMLRAQLLANGVIEELPEETLRELHFAAERELSEAISAVGFFGDDAAELVSKMEEQLALIQTFFRGLRRTENGQTSGEQS